MKTSTKILKYVLLSGMVLSFASCRNNGTDDNPDEPQNTLQLKIKPVSLTNAPLVGKGDFFAVKSKNTDAIFLHSNSDFTVPDSKIGFWVVNLENGTFSAKPKNTNITTAGIMSTIGTDGSYIYHYGGNAKFIRYNINTETWENYNNYAPNQDFFNNGSIMLNNKYYYIYNVNENVNNPIVTFETLSKTWSYNDVPPFPKRIDWEGAMVADNAGRYIYHLGGRTDVGSGPSEGNKEVYRLDTTQKKWEKISDINFTPNICRVTNASCIFKNKYLATLDTNAKLHLMDLDTKTWQTVDLGIQGYYNMALFGSNSGEKIYLLGTKKINEESYNYEVKEISEQ